LICRHRNGKMSGMINMNKTAQKQLQAEIANFLLSKRVELLTEYIDFMIGRYGSEVLILINSVLAEPYLLNLLIQQVRGKENVFRAVMKGSYHHENGFHKIVLLNGSNFKLRLHHFGAVEKAPMENIHNHRWSFASTILSGELKMELFQREYCQGRSEELYHFVYGSDKSSGVYSTELMGMEILYKSQSKKISAGQSYLMLPEELHRITNLPGQESMTLILTGKPLSKNCDLYAKRPILDDEKQIVNYTGERLEEILKNIQETIYPHLN
jgi:hypothetical protein